jgi:hypothetical protein
MSITNDPQGRQSPHEYEQTCAGIETRDGAHCAPVTGSAVRSAKAVLTDYVEAPLENGIYRLDIRGPQLDELWWACESDNRALYARIAHVNRLRDALQKIADEAVEHGEHNLESGRVRLPLGYTKILNLADAALNPPSGE